MRKIIGLFVVMMMAMSFVSCSSKTSIEYEDYDEDYDGEYERCIKTSTYGNMAETEDGFFYLFNEMLYYGDKTNMNLFVPVCNKPNCRHKNMNLNCNAYFPSESFAQKDGKLYGVDFKNGIFEFHTDGSGRTYVMKLPSYYKEKEGNEVRGDRIMLTQTKLLYYMKYLTENGMFQEEWLRFEDGEWYPIFSEQSEQNPDTLSMSGVIYWSIRGDFVMSSSLFMENGIEDLKTLWRMDGEVPEMVNFPENVKNYLHGSYLSGNIFRYYVPNEGYYKMDLNSRKKQLLSENQLEDGRGEILTKKYMVEYNFHYGVTPEEKYLKFYNGEKWIDVKLPKELDKFDISNTFLVNALASDRIFMIQNKYVDILQGSTIYYFKIDSNNPELILCDTVGNLEE